MKQFLLILLVLTTSLSFAQELPKPTGFVNDFAGLLTAESAKSLNDDLIAFEQRTSNEIVVVTVKSLGGKDIADYAREIGTTWGVGKKGKDNGIVFLIAPNERKMRIQTATGVRSILTDAKADEIRDNIVIPCFKSRNIPKGIIDGTHAIIDAFTPAPTPVEENKTAEAPAEVATPVTTSDSPQIDGQGWKEGLQNLGVLLAVGFVFALFCFFVIRPIRRRAAKSSVLGTKSDLAKRIAALKKKAENSAVEDKHRRELRFIEKTFSPIEKITADSVGVDWINIAQKANELYSRIHELSSDMEGRIELARQAKKDGPRLLKELPEKIEAAKKKLAEGKPSKEAERLLKEANARYESARQQQSGMSVVDWIILYELLHSSDSHIQQAESAHVYANTDHSNYESSNYSPSTGLGFGDSGSLGGGGGFDSGGGGGGGFSGGGDSGGSSGSW